jgi:hypothetical protein
MQKVEKNPGSGRVFYLDSLIYMRIFRFNVAFNPAIDLAAARPALDCCQIGIGIGWRTVALRLP